MSIFRKMSSSIDTQSVQGTLLSLLFLAIAQVFEAISVINILQGTAYFFTIVVAIDTLTGNRIKKWIIKKFSSHEAESKRTGSDQAL